MPTDPNGPTQTQAQPQTQQPVSPTVAAAVSATSFPNISTGTTGVMPQDPVIPPQMQPAPQPPQQVQAPPTPPATPPKAPEANPEYDELMNRYKGQVARMTEFTKGLGDVLKKLTGDEDIPQKPADQMAVLQQQIDRQAQQIQHANKVMLMQRNPQYAAFLGLADQIPNAATEAEQVAAIDAAIQRFQAVAAIVAAQQTQVQGTPPQFNTAPQVPNPYGQPQQQPPQAQNWNVPYGSQPHSGMVNQPMQYSQPMPPSSMPPQPYQANPAILAQQAHDNWMQAEASGDQAAAAQYSDQYFSLLEQSASRNQVPDPWSFNQSARTGVSGSSNL